MPNAEFCPAVRYAVNAYLDLVSKRSLLEAVASSLTEMFSRDLISLRVDRLRQHYPWLSGGLAYFDARLTQAPEDAKFALAWVTEHARTRPEQELALGALRGQVRHPVGPARRALFRLRGAGLAAAGSISAGSGRTPA